MLDAQLFCRALKFALHAASVRDIRYYLVGVRLEWHRNTLDIVGCDGTRLAHIALTTETEAPDPLEITIPTDNVKRVLSVLAKEKGKVQLTITNAAPGRKGSAEITAGGLTLQAPAVDGVYPQWRRVIPAADRIPGAMPRIDANLLAQACEAVAVFAHPFKTSRGVTLHAGPQEGDSVLVTPAPLTLDHPVEVCRAVVAPMREKANA